MTEGAVTRLSYSTTPGFPGCHRFWSPSAALRISTYSAAYVSGTCLTLTVSAMGRAGYLLSPCDRSHGHFLPCAVSVSPSLVPISDAWIGSKEGIAPPNAPSQHGELNYEHHATAAVLDRLAVNQGDVGECDLGLAAPSQSECVAATLSRIAG